MIFLKYTLVLLALVVALTACGHRNGNKPGLKQPPEDTRQNLYQPLAQKYAIVVVEPVAISFELARRYPQVARACQKHTIQRLSDFKVFKLVNHTAPDKPDSPMLLVRTRITDMRLSTQKGSVRPEDGAYDYISMDVKLVDAITLDVLQEQHLSTVTSIDEADRESKSGPHSDPVLALSKKLADYVLAVMPKTSLSQARRGRHECGEPDGLCHRVSPWRRCLGAQTLVQQESSS